MPTVIFLRARRPPAPLGCRKCGAVVYVSPSPEGWVVLPHDCRPLEVPPPSLRPLPRSAWAVVAFCLAGMLAAAWVALRW